MIQAESAGVGGGLRDSLGRDPLSGGAPHVPPPNETGVALAEKGDEGRSRRARVASGDSDVAMEGACDEVPPVWKNPNAGKSRYPFEELPVGHAFRVTGRDISTVKSAMRRWKSLDKARRGHKFQVWRGKTPEGAPCIRVKRVK